MTLKPDKFKWYTERYTKSIEEILSNPDLSFENISARIFVAYQKYGKDSFEGIDLVMLTRIFMRKWAENKKARFAPEAKKVLKKMLQENRELIISNRFAKEYLMNFERNEMSGENLNDPGTGES